MRVTSFVFLFAFGLKSHSLAIRSQSRLDGSVSRDATSSASAALFNLKLELVLKL